MVVHIFNRGQWILRNINKLYLFNLDLKFFQLLSSIYVLSIHYTQVEGCQGQLNSVFITIQYFWASTQIMPNDNNNNKRFI